MNRTFGFSLIELIITVAVISILATVALPSMQTYSMNDRLRTNVNILLGHLALARSEAVKRSQQVAICSSADQAGCNGGWADGWMLYVDANGDNSFDAGEEILRAQQSLDGNNSLSTVGINNQIIYDYRGFAGTDSVGTLQLCDSRSGDYGKTIHISPTGRARLERETTC